MSVSKKALLVAAGILGGALVLPPGVAMADKLVQDVFVTNTPDKPVPTAAQGTTNVAGTVAVSNTPTVQVGNDAGAPVPVREVGAAERRPFQQWFQLCFETSEHVVARAGFDVPDGKRLTIEYVSLATGVTDWGIPEDNPVQARLNVTETDWPYPGVDQYRYHLPASRLEVHGGAAYVISQPVLAHAGPGARVTLRLEAQDNFPGYQPPCSIVTVSGYEQDTPTGGA